MPEILGTLIVLGVIAALAVLAWRSAWKGHKSGGCGCGCEGCSGCSGCAPKKDTK